MRDWPFGLRHKHIAARLRKVADALDTQATSQETGVLVSSFTESVREANDDFTRTTLTIEFTESKP